MKTEVRCRACGQTFVADEESRQAPCPSCGGALEALAAPPAPTGPEEVVCPRCGLHFVPRAKAAPASEGGRKTVLVVEDMEYFQEIARDALGSDYDVRVAGSVAEAWQVLSREKVDLMLLDLTLGGREGGLELLEGMVGKPFPVLIYTAEDEADMYGEAWERLQRLGADDVVLKGMQVGESLLKKVRELLGDDGEEGGVEG